MVSPLFFSNIRRQYLSIGILQEYKLRLVNNTYEFRLINGIEDMYSIERKDFKSLILKPNSLLNIENKDEIIILTKILNKEFDIKFNYENKYYSLNDYYPMYNHINGYLLVHIKNGVNIKLESDKYLFMLIHKK